MSTFRGIALLGTTKVRELRACRRHVTNTPVARGCSGFPSSPIPLRGKIVAGAYPARRPFTVMCCDPVQRDGVWTIHGESCEWREVERDGVGSANPIVVRARASSCLDPALIRISVAVRACYPARVHGITVWLLCSSSSMAAIRQGWSGSTWAACPR